MSLKDRIKNIFFVRLRVWKYSFLSECKNVIGKPIAKQPLLLNGKGKIIFDSNCKFGYKASPMFYSSYCYIEARNTDSEIVFGKNNYFNNNCSIEANTSIEFGNDVLVGVNCSFLDNDGHHLAIDKRKNGIPNAAPIRIRNNVFIGDNVTVLKGVTIGDNTVIGNGSIVTKSIPSNSVAVGNPAKVIR
jgi:galactoside O-acetyltransferase